MGSLRSFVVPSLSLLAGWAEAARSLLAHDLAEAGATRQGLQTTPGDTWQRRRLDVQQLPRKLQNAKASLRGGRCSMCQRWCGPTGVAPCSRAGRQRQLVWRLIHWPPKPEAARQGPDPGEDRTAAGDRQHYHRPPHRADDCPTKRPTGGYQRPPGLAPEFTRGHQRPPGLAPAVTKSPTSAVRASSELAALVSRITHSTRPSSNWWRRCQPLLWTPCARYSSAACLKLAFEASALSNTPAFPISSRWTLKNSS